MLRVFEEPQNLPLAWFAQLARKSRQQIYKDLSAHPRRLPEWQLDPMRLRLTQQVLKQAADLDPWTLFHALSGPLEALAGRSPVEAVTAGNSMRW